MHISIHMLLNPVCPCQHLMKWNINPSSLEFTVGALLLGSELAGMSALLLSAVGGTRGESGIAPDKNTTENNIFRTRSTYALFF